MKKKESKKIAAKILAIVLAALFIISAIGIVVFTAKGADAEEFVLEKLDVEPFSISPIPLLCIRVSFDANKNGVDDWDPYNSTKLYGDPSSEYYGEQWIHSPVSYWREMLFSKTSKSLYAYYNEQSEGSFYFYAADETEGTVNDGIIDVTLNMSHPRARITTSFTADGGERRAALEAANEYVDFKSYDKDGNGYVDYDELAIAFIIAGYEHAYSSGRLSAMEAFGTHAHYTSGGGIRLDDVYVTATGHSGFVKCGEYQTPTAAITVGTLAHELGHFLGAYDLYDANGTWSGYVGDMSLMASGSHNSGSNARRGSTPSGMDPFQAILIGIATSETVRDGEYTLYSHESTKGDYNILRINTQNPNEYYLVENRYATTEGSLFDNTQSGCQGIIIWHIDEDIVSSGKINTANSGHDPGVVVLGRTGINAGSSAFTHGETSQSVAYLFRAMNRNYKFPKSGTWNTSLDEGTELPLEIDILDPGAPEMRIVVRGSVDCPPTVRFAGTEATDTTLKFEGKITDLCGGNVTSCGFILSKNANPTAENGIVINTVPTADGSFSATFEGLDQGTKYYCTVFASGNQGTGKKTVPTYTKFPPREDVEYDYYNVYMYSNYNNLARKYTRYVNPGELLNCEMTIDWAGYAFCGWYWDAELTQRYDPNYTQQTKDNYSLYGKWVVDTSAVKLKVSGAEIKYNFFAEIGDTYGAPVPKEREGYTFVGWYADEGLTEPFDFDTTVREDDDVTVYAKWEKNGGEPEPTTETTHSETTATTVITTENTEQTTPTETTPTSDGKNKGCGSVISSGAIVLAAVSVLGSVFAVGKKKRKE